MKISKTAVLIGGLLTTGLGLASVSGTDLNLYEPDNLVQHITGVKIIESGNAVYGRMESVENLVQIETNNFVLSRDEDSNKIVQGNYSSILGGSGNTITGDYDVILGGENNTIENGIYSSILGGMENKLKTGENSVIIGGEYNVLEGSNSSIVGGTGNTVNGDYSVVVGNNSHVTGSYSVVMGQNSNLNANSSFLWTDGGHSKSFTGDNVFAVIASGGMVINAIRPHNEYTQLTLGGPLVLSENIETNSGIVCSNGEGGGIVKVVNSGDKVCMCSCDGYERSSLFGLGTCRSICNPDIKPKCNTGISKHWDVTGQYNYYSGGCDSGNVVDGAYFVDKYNVVHWSCQSDDGAVLECTGSDIMGGGYEGCGGEKPTGENIKVGQSTGVSNNLRKQWKYVEKNNPGVCEWTCQGDYARSGNVCVIKEYACKGTYPSNAVTGSATYRGLTYEPEYWTLDTKNNPLRLGSCYFICPGGHIYAGGKCVDIRVQIKCDLTTLPEHAILNEPNKQPTNLKHTSCFYEKYRGDGTNSACSYDCDANYMYVLGKGCVEEIYTCTGAEDLPLNSSLGSSEYRTGYTPTKWTYTGSTDLRSCYWTCNSGFYYDGNDCTGIDLKILTGSCTGTIPWGGSRNNTMLPEGKEVTYYHEYHKGDGSENAPCTYYCHAPFEYNTGLNTCIDPSVDFCGFFHNECGDDAELVGDSVKSSYSGGVITYNWQCQLGDYIKDCPEEQVIDCKHCAKNGFPYCFPIDFSADCDEVQWWESRNINNN